MLYNVYGVKTIFTVDSQGTVTQENYDAAMSFESELWAGEYAKLLASRGYSVVTCLA